MPVGGVSSRLEQAMIVQHLEYNNMRHHLLVVSEKKIKMPKITSPCKELSIIGGATIFLHTTYIPNKYMYTVRAYYLQ